jgi:putative endonuclease
MWFTYIIYSEIRDRYYISHAQNPATELVRHNTGEMSATRKDKPWRLVYVEKYPTETDAIRRKKEIKGKKSRSYIEQLLKLDY